MDFPSGRNCFPNGGGIEGKIERGMAEGDVEGRWRSWEPGEEGSRRGGYADGGEAEEGYSVEVSEVAGLGMAESVG